MKYLSIIDKLIILFNLLKESVLILIFIGVLVLAIVMRILKKISNKKLFLIAVLSLFITFLIVLFINYDILSNTFDNFLDIVFTNIYFPSIYVYLFMMISTYVIVSVTLINKRISYISRVFNYGMAFILNLFMIINLNIIASDKIDIFSASSMYTNINLVSMLELSMNVYILWMVVVCSIYVINNITDNLIVRREAKKLIDSSDKVIDNNILIGDESLVDVKDKDFVVGYTNPISLNIENRVDENLENIFSFEDVEDLNKEQNVVSGAKFIDPVLIDEIQERMLEPIEDNFTFNQFVIEEKKESDVSAMSSMLNQILINTLPIQKETVKLEDETFTLSDYKIFSKMLKEAIKLNNSTVLNVSDMLNINLLNKFSFEEYSLFKKMLKSYTN